MTARKNRFWLRIFGNGHGGFYRATNASDTSDGWRCYGKPLLVLNLTKTAAKRTARQYKQAGCVVRIVEEP